MKGQGPKRKGVGSSDHLAMLRENLSQPLSEDQVRKFDRYLSILLDWNVRINLTAISDIAEIIIRHFNDSLSCIAVTGDLNGQKLIDVGSGAGFPGIPLKIACPELSLTLVDSVRKKTRFLAHVVEELEFSSVDVLCERVEILGRSPRYREQNDWALARGVASLPVLVEYLLPLVMEGGHVLAMKGEGAEEELSSAMTAINRLGGGCPDVHPFELFGLPRADGEEQPNSIRHYLVVIEKIGPTPEEYPRRIGLPTKRPLGQ